MTTLTDPMSVAAAKLQVADHVLTQTWPHVRDPSLLRAVLDNIATALDHIADALIAHDSKNNLLPKVSSRDAKRDLFMDCCRRNKLDMSYGMLMHDVHDIVEHKDKLQFTEGRLILRDTDHQFRAITPQAVRDYIAKAREIHKKINGITHA